MNTPAKVYISPDAEKAIDRMTVQVNEGFTAGKVSKQDLVSWIAVHFELHGFRDCMKWIRKDHFDQVAYLQAIVLNMKKSKRAGQVIPDLANVLAELKTSQKSRRSPPRTKKNTEAVPSRSSDGAP